MLTAPYNFVPLRNGTVILPCWAKRVQMELPFPHAISGSFDVVLEAVTPLMVAGETESMENSETVKRNFRLFDQIALPGSSVKGALRSVIEIASFGKIGTRIDDRRFAVRDLQNPYLYTARFNDMFRPLTRAGWLELDPTTGEWMLRRCEYSLVRQTDLEILHATARRGGDLNLGRARKTAVDKHRAWGRVPLEVLFDPDQVRKRDDWAKGREVSRADNVGRGRTMGTIVFTGQPANRGPKAKSVEFLFHSPQDERVPVPPSVRDDFEHVHRDANHRQPLPEWAFYRSQLRARLPIPVFWLARPGTEQIAAMGLAMMFRLAYDHSTRDLAKHADDRHLSSEPDLAETLFGYVRETKDANQALAGRVHIEAARLERAVADPPQRREILLSPKPGFYPAYVAQRHLVGGSKPPQVAVGSYVSDGKRRSFKAYTTYMDESATLRGWKRYPVSRTARPTPPLPDEMQVRSSEVFTRLTPLGAGTRFRTTLHVHNLLPKELGALLWAISFGDPAKGYCHAMGMARALGLGCMRITLDPDTIDLDDVDAPEHPWRGLPAQARLDECRGAFERYMEIQVSGWSRTPQIRLLQAMADRELGALKVTKGELTPMSGPAPFQSAKQQGEVLAPYLDLDVWPRQAPPPGAGAVDGRAARAGGSRPAARPPPAQRFALLDGERVEVLRQDGDLLQVRMANGDLEDVKADEVEPL